MNLLRGQEDTEGRGAAYQAGAALNNPEALYALVQLGQILDSQGDTDGAHAAWPQAIERGLRGR